MCLNVVEWGVMQGGGHEAKYITVVVGLNGFYLWIHNRDQSKKGLKGSYERGLFSGSK